MLSLQTDPRSPEHGQYGFLQDLVRHVAYETLSRRERRARHLAAATYLDESLGEDEVAEVIAAHYVAAYEAAPDAEDALEIRAKASGALTRAGERAERSRRRPRSCATSGGRPSSRRIRAAGAAARSRRAGSARANAPAEARALLEGAHELIAAGDTQTAALVAARLAELDCSRARSECGRTARACPRGARRAASPRPSSRPSRASSGASSS